MIKQRVNSRRLLKRSNYRQKLKQTDTKDKEQLLYGVQNANQALLISVSVRFSPFQSVLDNGVGGE